MTSPSRATRVPTAGLAVATVALLAAGLTAAPAHAAAASTGSDFNHDGFPDIVAGAPAATVGGRTGAGAISIVTGQPGGIDTASPAVLHQDSPGVQGGSEAGDAFGHAIAAAGDLNADGYDDLVVTEPGEDLDGQTDVGAAIIFYGSATGPSASQWLGLPLQLRTPGERFGDAVAAGDFNGNGQPDIAILTATGNIQPYTDGATTTTTDGEAKDGLIPGEPGRYAPQTTRAAQTPAGTLTRAAAGDFNNDGRDDLAITYLDTSGTATLVVIPGSAAGLDYPNTTQIPAAGGRALATGDLNNDGYADLVIGQPEPADTGTSIIGGAVTARYGSPSGITPTGTTTVIHQDIAGVPSTGEVGDRMGASLAVGDINNNGYDDLYTGLPGEDLTNTAPRTDAGAGILLFGGTAGLTPAGTTAINQDVTQVPGVAETGDTFASDVTLTDTNNDGHADLTAGVNGENTGDGGISYLPGAATNPTTTPGTAILGTDLGLGTASEAGTSLNH